MNAKDLKYILEKTLKNCTANIESHDNIHFSGTIISEDFNNIDSAVKRQKIVYSKISEYFSSGEIHAFSMKTLSTNEI